MARAIVGANWGDEGKGKITDMLAQESDIVIRFQGGSNAGHTIINNYGRFAMHLLPSGVFSQHTVNIIGNGVALNIPVFFKEYNEVVGRGVPAPKILISNRAQMVMSYHILFDQYEEERLGGKAFGSTKSGIAPFYSDKYAKIGFQVSELFDEEALKEKVVRICETKNVTLEHLYHKPLLKPEDIMNELMEYKKMVEPYVCDVSLYLWNALKEGKWDNLFDGDRSTYAWTNEAQQNGDYLIIDLGATVALYDVNVVTGDGNPRFYNAVLEYSKDKTNWTQIGSVANDNSEFVVPYRFLKGNAQGADAKYIRIRLTGNSGYYLKIHEVEINKEVSQDAGEASEVVSSISGNAEKCVDGDISSVFTASAATVDGDYLEYRLTENTKLRSFSILQDAANISDATVKVLTKRWL